MAESLEKPAHRNFKIPPLTPQNISQRYDKRWMRFHFLQAAVQQKKWARGAELGCLSGRTLSHLMRTCKRLELIGVDIWEAQPDNPGPEGWEHFPHNKHYEQCQALAEEFKPRLTLIRDWTHEAVKSIPDESLDFVFIDADHSYEGCRRDIVDWFPKVKPTGYLLGHDINWPGVRQAVNELLPGYLIAPNVVWFRPKEFTPGWEREWR